MGTKRAGTASPIEAKTATRLTLLVLAATERKELEAQTKRLGAEIEKVADLVVRDLDAGEDLEALDFDLAQRRLRQFRCRPDIDPVFRHAIPRDRTQCTPQAGMR